MEAEEGAEPVRSLDLEVDCIMSTLTVAQCQAQSSPSSSAQSALLLCPAQAGTCTIHSKEVTGVIKGTVWVSCLLLS